MSDKGASPPTPTACALAPMSLPLIRHLGLSGAEDLLLDPAGRELSDFHPPRIVGSRLKAPLLARPPLKTVNQGVWILVGSLLMSHTRTFLTRPTADPDRHFIQGCIKERWFLSQGQAHPHCPVPRAMASSLTKHLLSAHSSVTVTECTHCWLQRSEHRAKLLIEKCGFQLQVQLYPATQRLSSAPSQACAPSFCFSCLSVLLSSSQ